MFSRLHNRFGTAGLVVAIVALIAALAGGAYAASGGLSAKQKKEVKSIAKSFQGTGPAGPAGSPGPAGPQGPAGGSGKDGANGTSVTAEEFVGEKEGHCLEGGSKFTAGATKTFACNGEEGAEGSPWTDGGVLPSKATETGVWMVGPITTTTSKATLKFPVSFPIPLAAPVQSGHMHYINPAGEEVILSEAFALEEIPPTECLGTAEAPTAKPGNLCLYASVAENFVTADFSFEIGLTGGISFTPSDRHSATTGAIVHAEVEEEKTASGIGSWAVTAP